jgi:hypothetical protein
VTAERWTRLDRALAREAAAADGVVDLRPARDAADDPTREIRVGRMRTLEHLGLAEPAGPARWVLANDAEQRLRALGERGDIIKRLHKTIAKDGAARAPSSWALEGEAHGEPVIGRLIARGLDDELRSSAFAVVDGIDGRVHHLKLPKIEAAGDGPIGGIVELRRFEDARGRQRIALAVRSDLNLDQQVAAEGATWLDRRLVAREGAELSRAGFGAEVRAALDQRIDKSVARYLSQLDMADRHEPSEALAAKVTRLTEKLTKLKEEMGKLAVYERQMLASPDQQISMTDPDSRSMATSGRGSGVVGYNVQVAVDTEHHLIVTHEVTNSGSDRAQLANVAKQAKAVLGTETLEAVADRGYFSSMEIFECHKAGITVTLPKPLTSGTKSDGRFGKQDFVYLPEADVYRCPVGERLPYRFTSEEDGKRIRRYWTTACQNCSLKSQCTTGPERRIPRWEHEHLLEAVQRRLDANPEAMRQRRETVEHPFGTLKARMGATHFLTKTLPKVAAEMALSVLAYNLTRVMNIVGIKPLIAAIVA